MDNKCHICKKLLNDPSSPKLSMDCGGDCLECMAVVGNDPECTAELIVELKNQVWSEVHRLLNAKLTKYKGEIEDRVREELNDEFRFWRNDDA